MHELFYDSFVPVGSSRSDQCDTDFQCMCSFADQKFILLGRHQILLLRGGQIAPSRTDASNHFLSKISGRSFAKQPLQYPEYSQKVSVYTMLFSCSDTANSQRKLRFKID